MNENSTKRVLIVACSLVLAGIILRVIVSFFAVQGVDTVSGAAAFRDIGRVSQEHDFEPLVKSVQRTKLYQTLGKALSYSLFIGGVVCLLWGVSIARRSGRAPWGP